MEFQSTIVFFALTFSTAWLLVKYFTKNRDKSRPLCLPWLPIVGSIPFMSELATLHIFFTQKSKVLGNVMGLYLADQYAVVLSGREAIQEALVKNAIEFAQRPIFNLHNNANIKLYGIVEHPYNDHFKKFHHISLTILKTFGFGKSIMEVRIKREVEEMVHQFDLHKGRPLEPAAILTFCVSNVIFSILFGKRMQLDDPKFNEQIQIVRDRIKDVGDTTALRFFPFLRFLLKYKKIIKISINREIRMRLLMEERIQEALSGNNEECFVSCFVSEQGTDYDHKQLLYMSRDLFMAGSESASTTLQWLIILFANHQDVQKRAQAEMDNVISESNLPTLDDKGKLKYLEACILESMRLKTIAPLSILHVTGAPTTVQGKNIPAGTWIWPNIYSVHMDEQLWKDPQLFNPDRFLDETGEVINKNLIIPFSIGKRSCFGEGLARQEIFLFTAALIHQYDILPPEGISKISTAENVDVIVNPKKFAVRLIKRTRV